MLTISTMDMNRIQHEITLGVSPLRPDTPEEANFRKVLTAEIKEIQAAGGQVDLPNDFEMDEQPARVKPDYYAIVRVGKTLADPSVLIRRTGVEVFERFDRIAKRWIEDYDRVSIYFYGEPDDSDQNWSMTTDRESITEEEANAIIATWENASV